MTPSITGTRATVTYTHRDRAGNAGSNENLGAFATVDAAKHHAEAHARYSRANGNLHWRQFSPTTWGLMDGDLYTYILVSLLPEVQG